jgi:hypothetical protein
MRSFGCPSRRHTIADGELVVHGEVQVGKGGEHAGQHLFELSKREVPFWSTVEMDVAIGVECVIGGCDVLPFKASTIICWVSVTASVIAPTFLADRHGETSCTVRWGATSFMIQRLGLLAATELDLR